MFPGKSHTLLGFLGGRYGNQQTGRLAARSAKTKVVSLGNAFVRSVTLLIEVPDLDVYMAA